MKNILVVLALVAASVLYSTAVHSEEKATGRPGSYDQFKAYESSGQKDECLVVAKNCSGESDSVMKRVERLNREIEKGSAVYTQEELKRLRNELDWIYTESGDYFPVRM